MHIRTLTVTELPILAALNDYNDPEEMISANTLEITQGNRDIFGLFDAGRIIGELRVKYRSDDPLEAVFGQRAYLYAFRILPQFQGRGLGTELMDHVINLLREQGYRELTVGVEDDNLRAIHMYRKAGFTELLARKQEEYQGDSYAYNLYLKQL